MSLLALDDDWFGSYEPDPRAQADPAFVAWLALNGSVSAVAVAFLANLAAPCSRTWTDTCGVLCPSCGGTCAMPERPHAAGPVETVGSLRSPDFPAFRSSL
jgi:hypothetical protein